jgi:hypothetical protein
MVNFSKAARERGEKQGSLNFLGFTIYLGKSRNGKIIPKLKSNGKRIRSKLKKVNGWCRDIRNKYKLKTIWKIFCTKLRGHIQYYGVSYNTRAVNNFSRRSVNILFKWLNRRSQRQSFNRDRFELFIQSNPLPKVKVYHSLLKENQVKYNILSPLS